MLSGLIGSAAMASLSAAFFVTALSAQVVPSREYIHLGGRVIAIENAVPVTITTSSLPTGVVGVAYSAQLIASGGSGSYTWSVTSGTTLPSGLSIGASTGTVTGTPTASGTSNVSFTVRDSSGNSYSSPPLSLSINVSLTITTASPLPGGVVGAAYSTQLNASGGISPYTWSVTSGRSLPAGLSLNASTGVITGTPTAGCSCSFTITVNDSAGDTYVSPQLALTIAAGVGITTTSLPNGAVSSVYSAQLAATGGTPPYSNWIVHSGSLPSGLTLNNSTGTISGTPTAVCTCSFTVTVKDNAGNTSPAQSLSIKIVSTLTITTTSLPGGLIGTPYSQTLSATGGTPPYSWSQSSGLLPPGFSPISSGGLISGTPQAPANTYSFTVKVTDAGGLTATQALSITTTAALTITAASSWVYASFTDTITASQPVTWSLSPGSPGSLSTAGPSTTTVYTAPNSISGTEYATITGTASGNSGSVTLLLVNPNPSLVPQSGSNFNVGQPVTFTMSVGDSAGWSTSNDYLILDLTPGIGYLPYWANGCMVQYEPYINKVWLVMDDSVDFQGGILGSSTVLSNSQCSVNLATGRYGLNGDILTVSFPVTFTQNYWGESAMFVYDDHGPWPAPYYFGLINLESPTPPNVTVTPPAMTLTANQGLPFAAAVSNLQNTTVSWYASAGSISPAGVYTAPSTVSSQRAVTVTATSANPRVAGSATVTLSPSIPANLHLSQMTISSGSYTYEAANSISADTGFVVNGAGSVNLQAGSYVVLGPGFQAGTGTGTPTLVVTINPNLQ